MTVEQRKRLLLDYKLAPEDFYVLTSSDNKIIVRRPGVDKIAFELKMNFQVENIQTVPYGNKCCTTILGRGTTRDGDSIRTTASANPDNCDFPYYAEVAEKRCRHRIVLQLARLYEHDIHSEIEAATWTDSKNQYQNSVANVEKLLKVP